MPPSPSTTANLRATACYVVVALLGLFLLLAGTLPR